MERHQTHHQTVLSASDPVHADRIPGGKRCPSKKSMLLADFAVRLLGGEVYDRSPKRLATYAYAVVFKL